MSIRKMLAFPACCELKNDEAAIGRRRGKF
jgi:hypothetical protein